MKAGKKIIREKLNLFKGTILSDVTDIESALSWRLRTYFFPKSNQKASHFDWYILSTHHFGLDKKISLYEDIPYFKKLKEYKQVKESLRFIQQLRNALAHWELDEKRSNENEIAIYSPINFKERKLNDKLMQEFKEHDKFLLKKFGWEQSVKEKYG